jgi:hypothetical protein
VFATAFHCVGRRVDLDDLLDAGEVAELLGLASANVVNVYRGRYQDFPAPLLTRRGFAFGYAAMWRPGPETQVGPTHACEATPKNDASGADRRSSPRP